MEADREMIARIVIDNTEWDELVVELRHVIGT